MEFERYQSVKRYGTDDVDGIDIGEVWVFPKIDGTNASIWLGDDGDIKAGSRNRELSLDNDNAEFYAWVLDQPNLFNFLKTYPHLRLYGEWLVPHSLKTYKDEAWKNFYVFDVLDHSVGSGNYMPYTEYSDILKEFDIEFIPPIATIANGDYEKFLWQHSQHNHYLIKDGEGLGEEVVLKNYDFVNKFGRIVWAKIVSNDFKTLHRKEMGGHEINYADMIEKEIAEKYVTKALCDKTLAKVKNARKGWRSEYIPELLARVFHDVVDEEAWNIVKEHRYPKVDFKRLNQFCIGETKKHLPEIF